MCLSADDRPSGRGPSLEGVRGYRNHQSQPDQSDASRVWRCQRSDANMDTLFGTGAGTIGLSILRVRIAPDNNWNDELQNAKKAVARGAIVMATPWTPPASMKTNNN